MANDLHESATEPDTDAKQRIEDRLAAEYLRLVELTQAKDHFLTAVSHELRTPLTSILSSTELLAVLADLDGAPAELVGIVDRNVVRMLRLIDGLSLLARLESGEVTLDVRLVDVTEVVNEAVARLDAGDTADLDIRVDAVPGPPATGDPERLALVLDHLLGNATNYTPAGGVITIRAEPGQPGWAVTVRDTGIGIPAAEQAAVFGEFVRGSNARQAGIQGAGLGLALSRRIAELHGGRLSLSSVEGEGTSVTLQLPYAYADPRLRG